MSDIDKIIRLKALLQISDGTQDATLAVYLSVARDEILNWLYSGEIPDGVTDVPARYEPTQIMACEVGFNLQGIENQTASSENSISRTFKYSSMLEYIRSNVIPFAKVM